MRWDASARQDATAADCSPWAFPAQRRAVFRLSVLLRTGDPAGALRAAADADAGWARGEQHIQGTWAQIRIGAAIAHLLRGQLDRAAEEVASILDLSPGPAEHVTDQQLQQMTQIAAECLDGIGPIPVSVGKIVGTVPLGGGIASQPPGRVILRS